MSSRNEIFAALEKVNLPQVAMPKIDVESAPHDLVEHYGEMLAKVGGTLIKVSNLDEVQAYLDKQMADNQQVLTMVDGVQGNRQLNEVAHELADIDLALVKAEFVVAENGAAFVRSTSTGHRVLPFIAENLAAVVSCEDVLPTMHQAAIQADVQPGELGSFIAGPSKTADIEQALVVGAHGACSMTVFMLG